MIECCCATQVAESRNILSQTVKTTIPMICVLRGGLGDTEYTPNNYLQLAAYICYPPELCSNVCPRGFDTFES